jgi:hypothetical protein
MLVLPKAFVEICSIPAVLVHEDVRVRQNLPTLPDQESRALYSGTNDVADRSSKLCDLLNGKPEFRSLDGQQTSRVNPLAVAVLAADEIDRMNQVTEVSFAGG